MKQLRLRTLAALLFAISICAPTPARANSFGDAVLTVGIGAGVGAVIGLSTLPFYEDSGKYTKNIWIGAAIGAVLGVGASAFSALRSTDSMEFEDDYEQADKQDFSRLGPSKISAPESIALAGRSVGKAQETVLFHAPVQVLRF